MASPKLSIQLSLDKYEIKLIEDYLASFNKPLDAYAETSGPEDAHDVFKHWIWYRKVADNFRDFTREEVVRNDWGGDMEHGFGIFMHFLQFYTMDSLYFRTDTLNGDNPHLLSDLLKIDKEQTTQIELEIGMLASERLYWNFLAALYADNMLGIPDSDDLPIMEVMRLMRQPIMVSDASEVEEGLGNGETNTDTESSQSDADQSGADSLLVASSGEKMDVDEDPGSDDHLGELAEELDLTEDVESAQREQSSIDRVEKSDSLLSHQSNLEIDEDSSEKEYIPFAVWSLLRKASILQRRDENSIKIFEFLDENSFFEFYAPVSDDLFCRSPEKKIWLSGIAARITHLGIVGHLSRYGMDGYLVIEDPRQFLEYIPWEELDFLRKEERYALWRPQTPKATFDYYIFTDEETYRYCVTNDFSFPGLFQDGHVAFTANEIDATDFVIDMQQYWEKWSDCAVTQHPQTSEWFLLETIPGKRFREIWKASDRTAALTYFRNMVDHHRDGEPDLLKETLGLSYNPSYEGLLELIPFHQFEFDQEQPPMRGSRGLVYKASWKRPQKIGQAPRPDLKVVLKTVQVTSEKEKEDIFKELDVNFSALQGHVVNVTEFYGVTQGERVSGEGKTIFIVSEYALLGPAEHFLETAMTGDESDWEMILRSIWNIASGLNVLHTHGVVHRDLHWGNLLVTTNKDRKDLLGSVKSLDDDLWNLLISDLGEGKVIGGSSTIGRKYGPPEYRAPEIEHSNAVYTSAADMFSLGQLATDIVHMYWNAAERREKNSHLISRTLKDLITKLVESTDPKDRPTAHEIAEAMAGLWRKTMHEYDFHPENLDLVPYAEDNAEPEIPF